MTEHVRSVSLEELYKESDVISLHCPLTKENMAMIRKDSIAKMKDGVILLNTARGPLICEQDLKEALVSGKVSYAAMDVVETEPILEDSPLFKRTECIDYATYCMGSKRNKTAIDGYSC